LDLEEWTNVFLGCDVQGGLNPMHTQVLLVGTFEVLALRCMFFLDVGTFVVLALRI